MKLTGEQRVEITKQVLAEAKCKELNLKIINKKFLVVQV